MILAWNSIILAPFHRKLQGSECQNKKSNDSLQISHFAGQQMVANRSESNPDEYELHNLGLKVGGFVKMEDAIFNAPEFARSAFYILGDFIKDS